MNIEQKTYFNSKQIKQMKDLSHICGQHDQIDYSSDLHINFLTARNIEVINDFLFYDDTQLMSALNMYDFENQQN